MSKIASDHRGTTKVIDALVIGGGPAGLGAALGLCRQNHSVVLLDSVSYRNTIDTIPDNRMHMVATWDHRRPDEFRVAARKELQRYERFKYMEVEVVSVRQTTSTQSGKLEALFNAKAADGTEYAARKLILATGVKDAFPKIEGFSECWAKGIGTNYRSFHCLFCHGYEDRNSKSVGVLAVGECAETSTAARMARAAHQFSQSITIYTNGNSELGDQVYRLLGKEGWCSINNLGIKKLYMPQKTPSSPITVQIELSDGTTKTEDFLVHKPATVQASALYTQLGLQLTAQGDIKVKEPMFETSKAGVFAVGDCASPNKFVSSASTSGGFAAARAAMQLQAGF
ncbi:thioredoxin reductase [Fusarium phyllophilum]|uniref:Thioredoxin reductase n=1 Tax=Fusarium phyllophilum TaxID=47803 RepID=A0A8H5JZC0_9HYPO|nr:thioredoxin reductase [Fusarium phyllophilum]